MYHQSLQPKFKLNFTLRMRYVLPNFLFNSQQSICKKQKQAAGSQRLTRRRYAVDCQQQIVLHVDETRFPLYLINSPCCIVRDGHHCTRICYGQMGKGGHPTQQSSHEPIHHPSSCSHRAQSVRVKPIDLWAACLVSLLGRRPVELYPASEGFP